MARERDLTDLQFKQRMAELQRRIQQRTVAFNDDNAEKQRKRVERAKTDFYYFANTYFPHYIECAFGDFHRKWVERATESGNIWACIAARHHGKTVILAIILPIWLALSKSRKFVVFISENRDTAKERTESIRLEFMHNNRIKNDFDEQVMVGMGEEYDFTIKAGARFLAQGYKQAIRGKLHGNHRPDYCVIDDMEGHGATNPRIAQEKLRYVREELFGALNKRNGSVVWLGNLTHRESALNIFVEVVKKEKPNVMRYSIYRAIRRNGQPLWPEMFTMQDLDRMREAMGNAGFERHMMMNPIVEGTRIKQEYFKYVPRLKSHGSVVIACDPSLGESKHSDYKAISAITLYGSRYHILDLWIRQDSPEAMFEKWYDLYETYHVPIHCEGGLWQDVLWPMLERSDVFRRKGYPVPVKRIVNKVKKEVRIEILEPLYERGSIIHYAERDEDLNRLEEQLLNFPNAAHDDGPDALAMAISLIHRAESHGEVQVVHRQYDMNKMP